MRKLLVMLFFGAVLGLIVFLLIRNPEVFKQIYMWLIGLFGIITWPFRKLWDWLNSNDELNEIEQSNQQLKTELAQIKKALAQAQRKLEEERQQNKLRMEELQKSIRQEDQNAQSIQRQIVELRAQSLEDFKDKLPPAERQKMQEEIWKEVDFGL
jgi:biopolymer transport protein ExbB/TolQ